MVELDLSVLYLLAGMLLATASKVTSLAAHETGNNLMKHLDAVSGQLQGLSRSLQNAHTDLSQQQIEQCQMMGPMSDPICALLNIDGDISRTGTADGLSHFSPEEKRTAPGSNDLSRRKTLLDDLLRKQKFLEDLRSLVDNAQSSVQTERKRSCNLNLGFHCQTEQYSAIADMYNWLQSSLSPGRRKRSSAAKHNLSRLLQGSRSTQQHQ